MVTTLRDETPPISRLTSTLRTHYLDILLALAAAAAAVAPFPFASAGCALLILVARTR
jgi:hypothetical protein